MRSRTVDAAKGDDERLPHHEENRAFIPMLWRGAAGATHP